MQDVKINMQNSIVSLATKSETEIILERLIDSERSTNLEKDDHTSTWDLQVVLEERKEC